MLLLLMQTIYYLQQCEPAGLPPLFRLLHKEPPDTKELRLLERNDVDLDQALHFSDVRWVSSQSPPLQESKGHVRKQQCDSMEASVACFAVCPPAVVLCCLRSVQILCSFHGIPLMHAQTRM